MEKLLGWYEFSAEGLSLERLLNQCAQQRVKLRHVKKRSARSVTGHVAAGDLLALKSLAESKGWRLTVLKSHGTVRITRLVRQRALLACGVLAFFMLCWGLLSCVWFIDVRGAGPYSGEIERILVEHDVRIGRFGFLIDVDALEADIERQLTGLSWVGVHRSGVRLTISGAQAQLGRASLADTPSLIASRDGIVASVAVTSGTPAVKVGDAVRKGQVLVRGEERAWDGAVTPVRPEASIEARVWYSAEAAVSGLQTETVPTGAKYTRRTLCTPFFEYAFDDAPEYTTYDVVTTRKALGGSLPIWLKIDEYEAVELRTVPRNGDEVRQEAGLAATRLAQEKVPRGVRVVDKWVEYSMIKDGGYRATAVFEAEEEIAVPAGQESEGF